MVGSRRNTGRPTRRHAAAQRRRAAMVTRLGQAQTPVERFTAAAEYTRSTLANIDPHAASTLAGELVSLLVDACDGAVAAHNRRRETRR